MGTECSTVGLPAASPSASSPTQSFTAWQGQAEPLLSPHSVLLLLVGKLAD